MATLLAVDMGLRTGLAGYGGDGRLRWYRSQHFGGRSQLRRGAYGVLNEARDCRVVVLEGGGNLAHLWERAAEQHGLAVCHISAERWRRRLLTPTQQRSGADAKAAAETLARRVIAWSEAEAPTTLRHDAAEAICVGLWGVLAAGWLPALPDAVQPGRNR